MMRWDEFTAKLSDNDVRHLLIGMGAALMSVRQASEVATGNGLLVDARIHVHAAMNQLWEVDELLRDPEQTAS